MAISIGAASFSSLTAQPFGYDESDTKQGQTARKWQVTGLLKPSEWLSLLSVYDTWRNARINDLPSVTSGVVGTTINFSGTGAGGQTWSNVACWFSSAPEAEQSGYYLSVAVELVDANQSLQVLLKQEENAGTTTEDELDLGYYTINGVSLKLLKPIESYVGGPSLELTAAGVSYVSGPLVVQALRDIEGTTDAAGWALIRAWYEAQITTTPAVNTWFPVTFPEVSVANKIVSGVNVLQYTVSIQLAKVL